MRSRSVPIVETGWSCSEACTTALVARALRREVAVRGSEAPAHRHRVPIGLVLLQHGWIQPVQLREALEAQKAAGQGKLGGWLVQQQGVPEQLITRALSLQWSRPVLSLGAHDPARMAWIMPRLFVDAFGGLPMRVAAGQILYLGFEERPDPALALSLERMLDLRVETGLVQESLFAAAQERMLQASFPPVQLIEAASEKATVRALAKAVERARPVASRLVRVHDCLWLRMWMRQPGGAPSEGSGVEDVVCSMGFH